MTTPHFFSTSIKILLYPSILFVLIFADQSHAFEPRKLIIQPQFHTIQLSSLLPASICTPSKDSIKRRPSTLEVFHRHGPCSTLGKNKAANAPPLRDILTNDESRVKSINARLNTKMKDSKANLPVHTGRALGSGNYLVSVGLGTPKKTLSLIFDTGSDLTWTQCQPCARSCYKQQDPIFDPKSSTSYSNVSCSSPACSQLSSATGNTPGCNAGTCVYGIQYGDQSFSVGLLSKDTLTVASDVFPDFQFGCGQNNQGLFGRTDGLIGLGRDPMSIVSQTASKYGKIFSYCLPLTSSSTGYLTLGEYGASTNVKFTPFDSSQGTSFYFITILAISVGGKDLSISQSVFRTAGTIIDSGTVITRLPPLAYTALSSAFKQQMQNYPAAPAYSILDTCFDFSNYTKTSISVPTVSFTFGGGVKIDLSGSGTLIAVSKTQACLAFAGNSDSSDIGIFGNTQQTSFEVVYDVAGGKLGFGGGGC